MADELMRDLPGDLPTFLARFGTDAQCRAYLTYGRGRRGFLLRRRRPWACLEPPGAAYRGAAACG